MEAFESFVAVALEAEGLVVSEAVKFPVMRQTQKQAYVEFQQHGYEVDLVGARRDRLVLATVKSYFGSRGVAYDHVDGTSSNAHFRNGYRLLHDPVIRDGVLEGAAKRYGYSVDEIELRLYVGKFAGRVGSSKETHRQRTEAWCAQTVAGAGPIKVVGVDEVVKIARVVAERKEYRDNAVLVALKVLAAAGALTPVPGGEITP